MFCDAIAVPCMLLEHALRWFVFAKWQYSPSPAVAAFLPTERVRVPRIFAIVADIIAKADDL